MSDDEMSEHAIEGDRTAVDDRTAADDEAGPADASGADGGSGSKGVNPVLVGVVAVAVVLVGLVALLATAGGDGEADSSGQVVADIAPDLAGPTIDGGEVDIEDLRDEWVLVNFFATWCAPCVVEHPELVALSESRPAGLNVISVAYDEPAPVIERFFDERGGDWPVVNESTDITLDWGVIGLPESFLVAPGGEVVKKYKGGITAAEIEKDIAANS
ncbi:MAG: TlpA family protein disulfide reductase [Microthrixaceae bacterium]